MQLKEPALPSQGARALPSAEELLKNCPNKAQRTGVSCGQRMGLPHLGAQSVKACSWSHVLMPWARGTLIMSQQAEWFWGERVGKEAREGEKGRCQTLFVAQLYFSHFPYGTHLLLMRAMPRADPVVSALHLEEETEKMKEKKNSTSVSVLSSERPGALLLPSTGIQAIDERSSKNWEPSFSHSANIYVYKMLTI